MFTTDNLVLFHCEEQVLDVLPDRYVLIDRQAPLNTLELLLYSVLTSAQPNLKSLKPLIEMMDTPQISSELL